MVRVFVFLQVGTVRRPGWFVNQNPEVFWRTAPDRDSGSDGQGIHRGESVKNVSSSTAAKQEEHIKPKDKKTRRRATMKH